MVEDLCRPAEAAPFQSCITFVYQRGESSSKVNIAIGPLCRDELPDVGRVPVKPVTVALINGFDIMINRP